MLKRHSVITRITQQFTNRSNVHTRIMSTFTVGTEPDKKQGEPSSRFASLAARLVSKREQESLEEAEEIKKVDEGDYREVEDDYSEDDESDDDGFGAYDSIDNQEDDEDEGGQEDATRKMVERLVAARDTADAGTAAKITELLNSMGISSSWGGSERAKRTDVFGEVRIEGEAGRGLE